MAMACMSQRAHLNGFRGQLLAAAVVVSQQRDDRHMCVVVHAALQLQIHRLFQQGLQPMRWQQHLWGHHALRTHQS